MTVSFARSEVVLSTDPARLTRIPITRMQIRPSAEEVIHTISRTREDVRPQSEWHRIFREDRE